MLDAKSNVFVTGVTGLIGGEMLRTLITEPIGNVWALIRATTEQSPAIRLAQRLSRSGAPAALPIQRAPKAVAGDVTLERLGLSDTDYREIARDVDIIIHSAAETSFIRTAACRTTNIAGAKNLIEFTRHCERRPLLVCLSTAFVSGVVANACISEDDGCRVKNDHHNEYTHSKAVAEELVRSSGLPVLVVRPSVVLSAGIRDPHFARAILQFVPMLNEFDAIPLDPASRPDVVPVQFVVDSTIRLLQRERLRHDTYHVSCGEAAAVSVGEVQPVVERFFRRTRPWLMCPFKQWTRDMHRTYVHSKEQRKIFHALKNYLPFLNMNVVFDNSRLRDELGERFPALPRLTDYIVELLEQFAHDRVAQRWMRAKGA